MSSWLRVVVFALSATALVAAGGIAWSTWRFGLDDATMARHLEAEVRRDVDRRSAEVEALARRVAAEFALVGAATSSRTALPELFARLQVLAAASAVPAVTATVYVLDHPSSYHVLAWSDGPAGDVAPSLLDGPASLVVAPGAAGLRLLSLQPMEREGRRVAVVVAETVLAPGTPAGTPTLDTAFGRVTVIPTYAAGALVLPNSFVIRRPLLEVHYSPSDLASRRSQMRRRVLAIAGLPFTVALLALTGPLLERRPRRRGRIAAATLLAIGLIGAAAWLLRWLSRTLDLPEVVGGTVLVAGLVGTVGLLTGRAWWARRRHHSPSTARLRFLAEHAAGGIILAAAIVLNWHLVATRMTSRTLPNWDSALFPFDLPGLLEVWNVVLVQVAVCWGAAGALAIVAERWRLIRARRSAVTAAACWLVPVLVVVLVPGPWPSVPIGPALVLAGATALFAIRAMAVRRLYRRTTQSSRLLLGLLALLVPLAALYPLIAAAFDRTAELVIERDYAPQAARQSDDIRRVLRKAQDEIDLLPLAEQVSITPAQPVDTQKAFLVWNQTGLKSTRVVSDVELYGPDRSLVSRFALNFPEYVYRATLQRWDGVGCEWEVFGEVTRFGSSNRTMLHAERGICDADRQLMGAIVVHVAPTDYQALPFVASASPYADLLSSREAGPLHEEGPPGLELVVYGWSLQPLFTTNESVAWTISNPLFARIYRDASPFWTRLPAGRRAYRVFLLQNRTGVYALGYPEPGVLDHAIRLTEMAAVGALLFIVFQLAAVLYQPLARRTDAPFRVLLHEVRTSFYRKLFLFFVLVAVGPVLIFALAFGAYMQSRFRADIQSEAASVVAVARRVFDQIAAEQQPVSQPPTDDVMVWIRQVIDEDVNLFEGSRLVATSQRDLFNSGLLPGRTPATIYRKIALERLPSFVTEDQHYLVAATPVPSRGADAVLGVPLAPRQREIEREIDELNRGVLVGSVLVVLLAAALGASLASRVADPVARLTNATRLIAAGQLDVRIATTTADELRRLVDDFNTMTARLVAQRAELARANQLKAWNEMARQVAHEIKNPLTPIQLAAEHLERVHIDRGRPLGETCELCIRTILSQVRLLRQIASEFANFASEPTSRPEVLDLGTLVDRVVDPYRLGATGSIRFALDKTEGVFVRADRTLLLRAITNLVENAVQAMPEGGTIRVWTAADDAVARLTISDSGVGMEPETIAHAFEPYFSTKTGGSGLGLANARRNIEREGGTVALESIPGHGTTVTVTLPRVDAPRDGSGAAPA